MHSLLYMLARNICSYVLFRSTRGAMQFGMKQVTCAPSKLKLWNCERCGKMWTGDSDGEDLCGNCGTKLEPKFYIPRDNEEEGYL